MFKEIYKKIKKYETIVIARHVGPDPDSLGGQIGLKDIILNTFPNKKVYAVGVPTSKFKFMGTLDKMNDELYDNALLIALDTPYSSRVDGVDTKRFKDIIVIDHHPILERFGNILYIDEDASSVCQMIVDLCFNTKLKMTKYAAERFFMGIVTDTNRFLFYYTSPKTFDMVSELIKEYKIDMTSLYELIYTRTINEIKLQGYIEQNLIVTENGVGYIVLKDDIIKEYKVDAASAGNLVNNFNYIEGVLVWLMIAEDVKQNVLRVNIRSRGPIINTIAEEYNGGGHRYAAGVKVHEYTQVDEMIKKFDELCKTYKELP